MKLTRRQREIYDYLAEFIEHNGYAPSLEEIGRRAGYSRAMVHARYGSKDAILDAFFLHDYVKQLSPEQQESIILRFLQGFSVAETAQAMGKNEGAIKALQYRAVRSLARLLPRGFPA